MSNEPRKRTINSYREFELSDLEPDSVLVMARGLISSGLWPMENAKLICSRWAFTLDVSVAATDGRFLFINPKVLKSWASYKEAPRYWAFILLHEVSHGLLFHPMRFARLGDPMKANMAADLIINAALMDSIHSRGLPIKIYPGGLIEPETSRDYCLEELYYLLPDNYSPASAPNNTGLRQPSLDEDLVEPLVMEDETIEEVIRSIETVNNSIIAQHSLDRQVQGTVGVSGLILGPDRHRKLPVPWVDLVKEWASTRDRFHYGAKPDMPVYTSTGLIAPGRVRIRPRVGDFVMVCDSSGSISRDTWRKFLSTAQFVVDTLHFKTVHLLSVSHQVCDHVRLEKGDVVPSHMKGGGGTQFAPAFDWVEQNLHSEPEGLVYLTDGYGDFPEHPPTYPVLWALYGILPESCPWGTAVRAFG